MTQKKKLIWLLFVCTVFFAQHSFAQESRQTMQQIQSLLNEKNNRTPTQRKIDSHLLQAVRESRGEKMVANVELERADVSADAFGTVTVDIKADITNDFLSKLTARGGKIILASAEYHTVRATLNLKEVETVAGYPEVSFIEPKVKSKLVDAKRSRLMPTPDFEKRVANVRAKLTAYLDKEAKTENKQQALIGSVTSQGDAAHRATDVRTTYGFKGAGIKIGVLSDSYNAKSGAAADVTNGDLPGTGNPDGYTTPVTVVADYSGGEDEGRAMLQVIHDLAPAAILYFATADVSEAGFATNVKALRNTYGCNIILDDVGYFDEPVFQDGIVAQAVDAVTAAGALYFSAAGNSGSLKDGTSGVFEGDFNATGSATFSGSSKAGTIHNFGTSSSPVNGDIITAAGDVYDLNWSDPWGASGNDYDLFLISKTGTVKSSSTNVQSGTQNPYESITPKTLVSGDRLVVFKTTAAAVRAFHLNDDGGTMTVVTNGQTSGHPCAVNAFCMAATPAATAASTGYPTGPYPGAFVSTNKVEPYSSDGPRKIFYNPDGTAITSGNFLFATSGGTTLSKPDLTAADGVSTTLGSTTGLNPFFGTSCAAPHAGAIAALILSGNPSLTPAQVRTILTSTALDVENTGYDNLSGYGIIQAFQAAGQVNATTCAVPTGLAAGTLTNTSAAITWTAVTGATGYTLQYKLASASTYTTVTGITSALYNLSGLTAGAAYNVQVATVCSASSSSAYSTAIAFTTTGTAPCTTPTGEATASITGTTATFSWTAVTGSTGYNIQYRVVGTSTWTAATNTTATYAASGLTTSTNYEWQVQNICSTTSTSAFSASATFTTTGITYCTSVGGTADGITNVTFNTINNTTSGTASGYTDYTATQSTSVAQGSVYTLSVKINTGGNYTNYAKAWIDWNHDGTFSTTTEEYNLGTSVNVTSGLTTLSPLSITVPAGAVVGTTRMRVTTQYNAAPSPCTASFDGEVEDYAVVVTAATATCGVPATLAASSVTTTTATLGWGAVTNANSYSVQYRIVGTSTWTAGTSTTTSFAVTGLTAASNYEFQVATLCASGTSAFSASATFTTATAGGGCTDTYESNNTSATASPVATNTAITAMIGAATDVDWYSFTTTSPNTNVNVTLTNLPADYDLSLYNSSLALLGSSANTGTTSEQVINNTTTAATYYVKVTGFNSVASSTYNFTDGTANATSVASKLTAGALVQGNNNGTTTLVTTTSASSGYTGASGTYNAGAAARTGALSTAASGSAYFEFTLTPTAGNVVTLTGISFGERSTSTGPASYTLRSSLDGYASDIATGTNAVTGTWALKTNSGFTVTSGVGTAITFRIYGYGGTGSAAANTANFRVDDIALTGSVNAFSATACYTLTANAGSATFSSFANRALPVAALDGVKLFPVPVHGTLTVSFPAIKTGTGTLQVVNELGSVIKATTMVTAKGANTSKLNLSGLRPGVYMLKVNNGTTTETKKFIIGD